MLNGSTKKILNRCPLKSSFFVVVVISLILIEYEKKASADHRKPKSQLPSQSSAKKSFSVWKCEGNEKKTGTSSCVRVKINFWSFCVFSFCAIQSRRWHWYCITVLRKVWNNFSISRWIWKLKSFQMRCWVKCLTISTQTPRRKLRFVRSEMRKFEFKFKSLKMKFFQMEQGDQLICGHGEEV